VEVPVCGAWPSATAVCMAGCLLKWFQNASDGNTKTQEEMVLLDVAVIIIIIILAVTDGSTALITQVAIGQYVSHFHLPPSENISVTPTLNIAAFWDIASCNLDVSEVINASIIRTMTETVCMSQTSV
jgi:hypothetical protein